MSYHSDHHNAPRDTLFRPVGLGLQIKANCMGCGKARPQAGGKGRPGPRWRCSHCVAAAEAKAGRAAA